MRDPRTRNLSMWQYHLRTLHDLPPVDRPEYHVSDPASLTDWQRSFRSALRARLGAPPEPVPRDDIVEHRPHVTDHGFRRHRVVFASERHLDVPAWLLVPEGRTEPGPAVLAVHGHGPDQWLYDHGRDTVSGPTPDDPDVARALAEQCPPFGAQLARAGYVVLAPDLRGFGERWDGWRDGHRLCDLELAEAVARGNWPIGGNVHDLTVGLDVLADHELVDDSRLAAVGFSYGGTLVLFLAALDERVRAAFVSGAFSDPRAAAEVPFNVCGAQVLAGLLVDTDHVQLAAAIAPRALSVENGDDDFFWPAAAGAEPSARVAALYATAGAAHAFQRTVFAGPHRWSGEDLERFLRTNLE